MAYQRRSGPLDGHWITTLSFNESSNVGSAFALCYSSHRTNNGVQLHFAQAKSALNLYSHIKLIRTSVHRIISPIVVGREKKNKPKTQTTTISDMMARSQQHSFEEALLNLFVYITGCLNCIFWKN